MNCYRNSKFFEDEEAIFQCLSINDKENFIFVNRQKISSREIEYLPFLKVYVPDSLNIFRKNNNHVNNLKQEEVNKSIHPAIYLYVANNEITLRDSSYLEYALIYASRLLYETNNPNILYYILPKNIASNMIDYFKKETITYEDVINNQFQIKLDKIEEKDIFEIVNSLLIVDDANFIQVYNFIKKYFPCYLDYFEQLWVKSDLNILSFLNNLKLVQNSQKLIKDRR